MCGEHVYACLFSEGHQGITGLSVNIINKTDSLNPTDGEAFWTFKLDTFILKGLIKEPIKPVPKRPDEGAVLPNVA